MARYLAMIPARIGSKRVKKKNLRMLAGKPLIAYAIELACSSGLFDEVYVNSDADIIGEAARQYGARFYKRPEHLASDTATNDQFALDFMNAVPCDVLVQINPTSPLMCINDLERARNMFEEGYDAVLAVMEARVEGVFRNEPINWNPRAPMPPSQLLEPVYIFCNGILAWRTSMYRKNMEKYGCAVYGGDGRNGYVVLKGASTVDIDNEQDFLTAEVILESTKRKAIDPEYWDEVAGLRIHDETDVAQILTKDGVEQNDLFDVNHEIIHLPNVVQSLPQDRSASKRIINSPSNCVTLISQMPGEGNRRHHHRDWDEWWLIVEGQWEYEIDGERRVVKQGDLVFIARDRIHKVTAIGDSRAIRMAVSRDGVAHIYQDGL